jgi:hypothetical protein
VSFTPVPLTPENGRCWCSSPNTGFCNHAFDAKLWMVDAVILATRRPIPAGVVITVDYVTHRADVPWSTPCNCGAPRCRQIITHKVSLKPDVQARSASHVSPFLNRRISVPSRFTGK